MKLLNKLIVKDKHLISKRVRNYLAISIIFGFLWFSLETIFILILQVFLYSIGLIKLETLNQKYIPSAIIESPALAITCFIIFGLFRSIVMSAKEYTTGLALHTFIQEVRIRILNIGFRLGEFLNTHDVVSAFNEQVTKSGSYIKNLSNLAQSLTTLCFLLVLGFTVSPKELLLGLVLLVIIFSPVKILYDKVEKMGSYLTKSYAEINKHILLGLKNNFFLKVFKLIPQEVQRGENRLIDYETKYKNHVLLMSLKSSIPLFLGFFIVGSVCWIGLKFWGSSSATLLSFFYLFLRITQSMSDSNSALSNLKLNQNSFEVLSNWVRTQEDQVNYKSLNNLEKFNEEIESIQIKNLSFGYRNENILFDNLDLKLNRGDSLLIKGPSGAGKSTLLKLILGLEKPTSGDVFFNNHSISNKNFDCSDLLAYVGPEPFLIPGTVRENLIFGLSLPVSDEEIYEALEKAQLKNEIKNLSGTLDYELTEFAILSTGQKQRMSLARAFLRKPKILILDEATANLDSVTESQIIEALFKNKNNLISIIISHKDSFDQFASQKIILKGNP